jgi:hypothetical protein
MVQISKSYKDLIKLLPAEEIKWKMLYYQH